MQRNNPLTKIGMVNFINTAPFYEIWKRSVNRPDWTIFEGDPAKLNNMLYSGAIDLGFISSHEYAAHSGEYKILADLSISASGPVGSVVLLSKYAPAELSDRLVLLSSQSQTSASLVKIILEDFLGTTPRYASGSLGNINETDHKSPDAVMAIGDQALRLSSQGDYPFRLDLAEIWQKHTNLPFVFAVWAVREEFCRTDPDNVVAIHHELLRCIQEGQKELATISRKMAPRIPMSEKDCLAYLSGLEYDLGPKKQEALKLFFNYLIKRGEVSREALPIKICG